MSIIENTSSENGDIMRIRTEVPIIGLLFLNTFTDSTENETGSVYFSKQFRYSNNAGLTFTTWQDLTSLNIQNVEVSKKDQFILEYKYLTTGVPTTPLVLNSIDVSGQFENLEFPIYETTLYKQFFEVNDPKVLGWALNVLEKLYREGILPEYVKRGDDTEGTDEDFIVFWNSVTHFFALIVYFFRQYENIAGNKQLIKTFLGNKDIALPVDENLEDLSYLLYNYIDEYRKRGTERIYYKEGENNEKVNGELLRLIDFKEPDEFILGLIEPKKIGWCIGESSPTWTEANGCTNLIKGWEFTKSVNDLNKYPLINDQYISRQLDGDLGVMRVAGHAGTSLPVGVKMETVDVSKLIKVNKGVDYEISFRVKKLSAGNDYLRFGIIAYNTLFQVASLKSSTNGSISNSFFSTEINNTCLVENKEYWIRGVLFKEGTPYDETRKLNFKNGRGLVLNKYCNYICPYITFIGNSGASSVEINDIKIRPMNLPFSQGQIGIKNVISGYLVHKGEMDFESMKQFVEKKLIPYDTYLKINSGLERYSNGVVEDEVVVNQDEYSIDEVSLSKKGDGNYLNPITDPDLDTANDWFGHYSWENNIAGIVCRYTFISGFNYTQNEVNNGVPFSTSSLKGFNIFDVIPMTKKISYSFDYKVTGNISTKVGLLLRPMKNLGGDYLSYTTASGYSIIYLNTLSSGEWNNASGIYLHGVEFNSFICSIIPEWTGTYNGWSPLIIPEGVTIEIRNLKLTIENE